MSCKAAVGGSATVVTGMSARAGGTGTAAGVANTTVAARVAPPPPQAPARKLLQGRLDKSALGQQKFEAVEVKVMAYVTNSSVFESLVGACASA
jgi:hypothetical protein